MRKQVYLWGGLLALTSLTSCYKDHSTDASHALSLISEAADASALQDVYPGKFNTTFTLTAPNFTQAGTPQELSYRWEVYSPSAGLASASQLPTNYEGRELRLPINEYGAYRVRLHVSNADNVFIKEFQIQVDNSYSLGLYALVDQNGTPEVGYIPASGYDSSRDAETFSFGLQAANPVGASFTGFTGRPTSFAFFNQYSRTYVNVAMDNGGLYTLNAGTLQVGANLTNVNTNAATYLYTSGAGGYAGVNGLIRGGEYFTRLNSGGVYMRQPRQWQTIRRNFPGASLANRAAYVGSSIATFDNTTKSLFFFTGSGFSRFEPTATALGNDPITLSNWNASTLVDMTAYEDNSHLALLLRSSSGTLRIARMQPATGGASAAATFLGISNVPSSLGLTADSRMVGGNGDLLYLASGNSIYAYIAGSTAFPSTPLISLSGSATITDLLVRVADGARRLYVATSDGTMSTISSYTLNEGSSQATLEWTKTGISGKVVQIAYRATR